MLVILLLEHEFGHLDCCQSCVAILPQCQQTDWGPAIPCRAEHQMVLDVQDKSEVFRGFPGENAI